MIKVDNRQSLNKELERNEKVLALFYASWCPYCMMFLPAFSKSVENLHSEKVVHVLLDDYDNPMWDDYNIEAVPTVIFFEKGKASKRLDGRFGVGLSAKQFTDWLIKSKLS